MSDVKQCAFLSRSFGGGFAARAAGRLMGASGCSSTAIRAWKVGDVDLIHVRHAGKQMLGRQQPSTSWLQVIRERSKVAPSVF